jgi:hypothetical protein
MKRNHECSNPQCNNEWTEQKTEVELDEDFEEGVGVPKPPCPKCGSVAEEYDWMSTPIGSMWYTDFSETQLSLIFDRCQNLMDFVNEPLKLSLTELLITAGDEVDEKSINLRRKAIRSLIHFKTIIDMVVDGVGDDLLGHGNAQWLVVGSTWDCPESPFGLCAYHHIRDRAHDNCIFCHDPEERK